MRYAVIHCRNPKCLLKVWVPASALGRRGHCPKCGEELQAPQRVPADELIDGPAIMDVEDDKVAEPALATT